MQTIRLALTTAAASWIFRLFLPWWSIVLGGLLAGMLYPSRSGICFAGGFTGAALLWGGYAALINVQNNGLLAGKMGQLLGGMPGWALVLVTAFVGGLYGGLGALLGSALRKLFWPTKKALT